MRKIFSLLFAALMSATMFAANSYWYRGADNDWGATAMTVSTDGLYEYIQSSNATHQFKIAASADGWDYNYSFVQAGFNGTDVSNIGDYGADNCYSWQSGTYYILVYYPNSSVNSTDKPIICASTTLPNGAAAFAYYLKNNWDGGEWTWKKMTQDGDKYKLEEVVFGTDGVNYNTSASGGEWVALTDIKGDAIGTFDTVTFVLDPTASPITITATLVGKYVPSGEVKYYLKNNWDTENDWTWKEMTKDGDNYKLEEVIFGGGGVNYNNVQSDTGATWVALDKFQGDAVGAKDKVTFVLDPAAGTISVTLIQKAAPTAIDNTAVEAKAVKVVRNGMLLIEKDGKTYNVLGTVVR